MGGMRGIGVGGVLGHGGIIRVQEGHLGSGGY